ncbi:MAG: type 1 glutamine amidotransferase domain-containing protein [Kordiimonas sp.]
MIKISKILFAAGALAGACVAPSVAASEKVLFVLSAHHRGYSLPESMDVYEVLTANGVEVEFASPQGVAGLPWGEDRLAEKNAAQYKQLVADGRISSPRALADVSVKDYDALYVPGGYGPMYDLQGHPQVQRILSEMHAEGKIISAICHGPAALTDVKLESGKTLLEGYAVTGKPIRGEGKWAKANLPFLLEKRMKREGGQFSAAEVGEPYVVHDGQLLTGQNANSAKQLGTKMVEIFRK